MAVPETRAEAADLLGVPLDAPTDLVNDRYRGLARIYHPDLNPDDPVTGLRMQELNAARELLLGARHPGDGPWRGEEERGVRPTRPPSRSPSRSRRDDEPIKRTMHQMPYGIYIIGSARDGEPNGMIADWVMQVSFEPRLVAVAFENDAYSLQSVRRNPAFTVNLLAEDGMDLAARFLQPRDGSKIGGRSAKAAAQTHAKLAGVPHRTTAHGCPILEGALSWLDCEVEQFTPAGDHTLVLGHVVDGAVLRSLEALTSTQTGWSYSG